jgi:hypothetical protein
MSAEKRAQHDVGEKEEMEGRSIFLLEKLSRQLETRNELAAEANEVAKKRTEALQTFVKYYEKVVSVTLLRT